ncbi:MFS general substrate transporter, partial [Agrocybe pediades]
MDVFHAEGPSTFASNATSSEGGNVEGYELRPIPVYLSERTRRPSTLTRADTDKTDTTVYTTTTPSSVPEASTLDGSAHALTGARHLTKEQERNSLIHFITLCWCVWLVGWNDGTAGPLLPRLQQQYNIGFALASLIFVGSCFGYITGATLNVWMNDRLGFGKILVLGAVCQICGYALIIPAPPFPLLVCAYVIVGFALSVLSAQANGFVGSLKEHMSTKLGIMHGAYGLGAFTSPFASTYFSRFADHRWAYHFIFSTGFSVLNVVVVVVVFRFRRQEEVLLEAGQEPHVDAAGSSPQQQGWNQYRHIFALKAIPLLIAFALIYIGVEVTLGGWIVTFIIHQRDGGASSGYISSGFFGGLTLGRVGLMWLNKRLGEHRATVFYSIVAIALELTVWFVPSIIENAVAVSIIGLVLGPMYPLLVSHMTHILPRWLLTACVGLVTGIGVAGSAALPFITGLLASKYGIASLQPLMVSMMGAMLLAWVFVPKSRRV